MRIGLSRDPHVAAIVRILSASNADKVRAKRPHHVRKMSKQPARITPNTFSVVGALHSVWALFDEQSLDGKLPMFTLDDLDGFLKWPGFAQAMCQVGWISYDGQSLQMHNFNVHNGSSARRRALESLRKLSVRKMSASNADIDGANRPHPMRAREEKRREENLSPKSSKGGKQSTEKSPSPKYTQADFDARDLRKIATAEKNLRQLAANGRTFTDEQWIREVCQLTGILPQRYVELQAKLQTIPGGEHGTGS